MSPAPIRPAGPVLDEITLNYARVWRYQETHALRGLLFRDDPRAAGQAAALEALTDEQLVAAFIATTSVDHTSPNVEIILDRRDAEALLEHLEDVCNPLPDVAAAIREALA